MQRRPRTKEQCRGGALLALAALGAACLLLRLEVEQHVAGCGPAAPAVSTSEPGLQPRGSARIRVGPRAERTRAEELRRAVAPRRSVSDPGSGVGRAELDRLGRSVRVLVIDADGQPRSGAALKLLRAGGRTSQAKTDPHGEATLPGGPVRLRARLEVAEPLVLLDPIAPISKETPMPVLLRVEEGCSLAGRVRPSALASSGAMDWAEVRVERDTQADGEKIPFWKFERAQRCDPRGRFHFAGLRSGRKRIVVTALSSGTVYCLDREVQLDPEASGELAGPHGHGPGAGFGDRLGDRLGGELDAGLDIVLEATLPRGAFETLSTGVVNAAGEPLALDDLFDEERAPTVQVSLRRSSRGGSSGGSSGAPRSGTWVGGSPVEHMVNLELGVTVGLARPPGEELLATVLPAPDWNLRRAVASPDAVLRRPSAQSIPAGSRARVRLSFLLEEPDRNSAR